MSSNKGRIAGWVLTGLVSAFLIFGSAIGKFIEWEGKAEMFEKFGFSMDMMTGIGALEVALALGILIPRIGFVSALLLTAYLGGATVTHVRIHDPFYFPILVGIVLWIGMGLRMPEIFRLAAGRKADSTPVV